MTTSTNLMKNSLIPAAITKLSEGSTTAATFANRVLQQTGPTPMDQICQATAKLISERRINKKMDEVDNGERLKAMTVKPEFVFSFLQNVMNTACWAARQLHIANISEEAEIRLKGVDSNNGVDWSQDIAEQHDVEPQSNRELEERIEQDYILMMRVYAHLCPSFSYLNDLNDLYMFSQNEAVVDETTGEVTGWQPSHSTTSWSETLPVLEQVVEDLKEESDAENVERLSAPQNWVAA